jgi:hypothetical protein
VSDDVERCSIEHRHRTSSSLCGERRVQPFYRSRVSRL